MTNEEIITRHKRMNGLSDDTPLHTYKEWQDLGFQVKKGSHSNHKITIWKPRKKKKEDNTEIQVKGSFFMVKASFFTIDQTERIEEDGE